jgi:hypothetical protein
MSASIAFELLDRRVLAGLGFVDPAGARVRTSVAVLPVDPAVKYFVKRAGEIVITDAPGLHDQTFSFLPPTPPAAPVPVTFDIKPSDRGLGPRRFTLQLPRNADPAQADAVSTLVLVPLLAAPAGTPFGMAAAVRVTVTRGSDGYAIEDALVTLQPEGGRPKVSALTDAAGEALLIAGGIPIANTGAGPTVQPDIGGSVVAIVDPALSRFNAPADLQTARQQAAVRQRGFVDPDDLATRLAAAATAPVSVRIAPGQTSAAGIQWTAP